MSGYNSSILFRKTSASLVPSVTSSITDLGVVRECAGQGIGTALVRKLHELAGGEENIIMYTCFNEKAYGFYEKLGMSKPDDVVVLNRAEWTDFTVE